MNVTCWECGLAYDDADRLTFCPHELIMPADDLARKKAAIALMDGGSTVRFNHQRDSGPDFHILGIDFIGMVTLRELPGYFAPHLFVHPT